MKNRVLRNRPVPTGRNEIRTADPILRRLFEIMYRSGIRNCDMAKRIGVATQTISRMKKGVTTPTITTVNAMAQILGVRLVLDTINDQPD